MIRKKERERTRKKKSEGSLNRYGNHSNSGSLGANFKVRNLVLKTFSKIPRFLRNRSRN